MPFPLSLLLAAAVASVPAPDLSFRSGRLDSWQGNGFYVTTATGAGPSRACAVSSSDDGRKGRTARLYQTFVIPPGVGAIQFRAAAVRPKGREPGGKLDVVLEAAEREFLPKEVRAGDVWEPAGTLLPPRNNRPRDYRWRVDGRGGQTVRIAVIDDDARPGCFVFCTGFRFVSADEINGRAFADDMVKLERAHHLPPMVRLDSDHFLAIGDADDVLIEHRLYNCETLHAVFFDHFRRKGFAVRPPAEQMMVAVLDSQEGFEASLGQRMPSAVTGLYNPASNRLYIYDFARNRAFQEAKKQGDDELRRIPNALQRQRAVGVFSRAARDFRDDANIGTVMHEAAHQLSFNCGMLNRDGDVALWLAEGLACYCESTTNGAWQGMGELNPMRVGMLAVQVRGKGPFYRLRDLVESDDWLRRGATTEQAGLGYAQSWALFRLLMEERPEELRKYLELIYTRRTPDSRLEDFVEAFGSFSSLEARYQDYIRELVEREAPKRR